MGNSGEPLRRRSGVRAVGRLVLSLFAAGFVVALLAGPTAHASSPARAVNLALPADECTPPTNPYGSSTTIADCDTTTTSPEAAVTLSISYNAGHVHWRACVNPSAAGSNVQLYISGTAEDSAQVVGDGCTPSKNLELCLRPGTYHAVAVDQPYGQGSADLRVEDSRCANPADLSASASVNGSNAATHARSGGLAFTGTNIALLVIAAAALLTIGTIIVRMTRQRRAAG